MAASVRLDGRLAVVTGASRGIGLAVATLLAGEGAHVVMLARGQEALEARARELGDVTIPIVCDVADRSAVQETAERIERDFGAPDLLVNNAGLFPLASVEETTVEQFATTLEANLVAPFAFVRAFLPAMRARGAGHLVTVGSIADRAIFPGNGAYAASKYGARALHEVVRAELRGTGVRASLVSPGPTDTSIWDPIDPDNSPGFTPRASMLTADMVADAILWTVTRDPAMNVDELRLSRS